MRYLRAGSGPALILLHGLLGYSFSWRFTMPALAPYATVYAPDMLGSGFSDRAFGLDYSMRACARRVVRFAEHLRLSFVDLLGTSHGGGVAMMAADEFLAASSGVKLNSLVLVAPVNPYSSHGKKLAPFLGTPLGAASVPAHRSPHAISFSLRAPAHVWRSQQDSSGHAGGLPGSASYPGAVRAWA